MNEVAVDRVRSLHPEVKVVADADAMIRADLDVYAPCALGGSLNDDTVPVLRAKVVCGAANNQLAHTGVEKSLADRGVLYAPDYVVNSGGVIQVADEIEGFNFDRAKARATGIYDTTKKIFALAADDGVPPRRRPTARGAPDDRDRQAPRDPPLKPASPVCATGPDRGLQDPFRPLQDRCKGRRGALYDRPTAALARTRDHRIHCCYQQQERRHVPSMYRARRKTGTVVPVTDAWLIRHRFVWYTRALMGPRKP